MDAFNFRDIRVEKANAIVMYRGIKRIMTLFRFVELLVFLIIILRFSNQFVFSFKLLLEHLKGISLTLISPQFVFVLGNAIVITLIFLSGKFSPKSSEKYLNFYDEYVVKCHKSQQSCSKENKKYYDGRIKICRSYSENLERAQVSVHGDECNRELRRSMTEGCRTIEVHRERKVEDTAVSSYVEDKMSSEEFRRTVEAFIARQQKILRGEEEFSTAMVSV